MAVLTYCHAPAHSCSRAIPCEDRALAIRGFPRPAPCREGCKVFFEERRTDPSRSLPSMGGSGYNRQHRASPSPHRGGDARRAEGVRKGTESRPQMRQDCLFISRKGRKGRRTTNANYAIAEVVAGYARQRAQRQRKLLALTPCSQLSL